jgi:DNA-binding transcriptional ArsR family regulator
MAKHDPDLSRLFHALADPTRRSILTRLSEGPAPVMALANPTGLRLPTVMRHLRRDSPSHIARRSGYIAAARGRIREMGNTASSLSVTCL